MSRRIIISGRERVLNPLVSLIMSLIFTGTGEVYSGYPLKGITLALLRAASLLAVPFYSITNIKSSYLTEVLFSLLLFTLITFFSPLYAFFISIRKKKIIISAVSSVKFIVLSVILSSVLTIVSATLFFSFFSITRVNLNYPPIIESGDIALIKKSENQAYRKGEMIVLKDENLSFARIIGIPGESITSEKGRFSVDRSELPLSIFTEDELNMFSLTDLDVISETQGEFKYPVIQDKSNYKLNISLKEDRYFAVPDDRNDLAGYSAVKKINIYGRLEGLLFSSKRVKLLIKPFRPSE